MEDDYKEIDFSKINVEHFAKRTRQQIKDLKEALKKNKPFNVSRFWVDYKY